MFPKRHRGSYQFLFGLVLITAASLGLYRLTRSQDFFLPLSFNTAYEAFSTLVSWGFFTFFLLLVIRHVLLMLIGLADHLERYLQQGNSGNQAVGRERENEPLVSIIVPAYNEGKCIESSIKSLLTIDYSSFEIIVVDDGSTDDTLLRARKLEGEYGGKRVVVYWKTNGGKSTALNFGIEHAAGDIIATIDSDSAIEPQSLRAAVAHFRNEDVGAVAGNVVVVNTCNFWGRIQSLEYIRGLNLLRRAQGFLRAVSIVPGPIGLFRRSALQEVGYYDHDTFAEDCDLTLKLLVAGWKIVYEPLAVSRTEAPEKLLALIKQRYRWTRGILQALRKHRTRMFRPAGAPLTAVFMLWYMAFESLLWPLMTAISIVFTGILFFDSTLRVAGGYFWLQLLLIDMLTSLFCLGIEGKSLLLTFYAPIERVVYQPLLDIVRILASAEEIGKIKMTWGKLDREGRI